MTENTHTEIAIIGGGLVGYTAALAFAHAGFSVALLEAKKPDLAQLQAGEGRAIALAHTSCLLYQSLGLWSSLREKASPIQQVVISEANHFGKCRINAQDYGLKALGYIVPATEMAATLLHAVQADPLIRIHAPFVVEKIEEANQEAIINAALHCKLVLACDGTHSFAREYFHIPSTEKDYERMAVVANISLSKPHEGRAVQRFTELGVLALLPLPGQRMTSVLTLDKASATELLALDDQAYLKILQNNFGLRGGVFSELGKRFSYPLVWMQADQVVCGRTLLLGNAAHTISPVAAQGLNLALRDLALLYDLILAHKADIGDPDILQRYANESAQAQRSVLGFTDRLTDWVKSSSLGFLRSAGLFALDHLGVVKDPLAKSLMGFSSHGGSLMRGADHDL